MLIGGFHATVQETLGTSVLEFCKAAKMRGVANISIVDRRRFLGTVAGGKDQMEPDACSSVMTVWAIHFR